MAQTTDRIVVDARGGSLSAQIDYDEAKALSTSMANVLVIDDIGSKKNTTIIIRLDDGAIDGDYQIFTTNKQNPGSTVTEDHWFAEVASTALTHNINVKQRISGEFTAIVVQAKADSGTPTLKIWSRSLN